MRKTHFIIFLTFILSISAAFPWRRTDFKKGMNKNVCKELRGEVLLYAIFVDSRETTPWTEFDIRTTLDSINVAVNWLEKEAKESNIDLTIRTDHFIGKEFATISKNLPLGTVQKSATEPSLKEGLYELNRWADFIARKAGESFDRQQKDGIPEVKNLKNKERLIAYLRDNYQVESVALIFMVNNYFKTDISVPINTLNTNDVEFAIVSYKYPTEIAHNLLHLFGAADLYKTLYRKDVKKIKMAQNYFPNDIMQNPYGKKIQNLLIGECTKYLIGWKSKLDKQYQKLLTD